MRHEDARERLPELLGLHPATPDETELRAHVTVCADCQVLLADMGGIERTLRSLALEAPSPVLKRRILGIPDGGRSAAPRGRRWGWLAGTAAALVVALAVTLSVVLTRGQTPGGFGGAHGRAPWNRLGDAGPAGTRRATGAQPTLAPRRPGSATGGGDLLHSLAQRTRRAGLSRHLSARR